MVVHQHLDLEADIQPVAIADEEPKIHDEFVKVDDHVIFTLNAEPSNDEKRRVTVILLHDQINDSYVWSEIKTLQTLSLFGYSSVALDLPSHGRSVGHALHKPAERAEFLAKFLNAKNLNNERIVLVGTSMAGQFVVPFLNNLMDVDQKIVGVVGIGMSDTQELDDKVALPKTLLIRGELDTSIGLNASNAWKQHENVRQFVIPNGKHLCHINNPQLFNKVLVNFLNSISV